MFCLQQKLKERLHPLHYGIILMLLTGLFFSIMVALTKQVSQHLPVMEVVFFRGLISALLILPIMIKIGAPLIGSNKKILLCRGFFGFVSLAMGFYAVSKLKLADAVILGNTAAIFVPMLSASLLKEKFSAVLYVYVALGLLGAGLIVKPSGEFFNFPAMIGLGGGLVAALAYVSVKKLQNTESPLTIVFTFASFSALAAVLLYGDTFIVPDFYQCWLLFGVGLTGAIGQFTLTRAYFYGPAALINPYQFSTFLFALLFAFIFWGEIPDWLSLAGSVLIIVSGIKISGLKEIRLQNSSASETV